MFASVGYGCNAENALIGLITTNAQEKLKQMGMAHKVIEENMLNTRSKLLLSLPMSKVKVYALQLFDKLTITELNNR